MNGTYRIITVKELDEMLKKGRKARDVFLLPEHDNFSEIKRVYMVGESYYILGRYEVVFYDGTNTFVEPQTKVLVLLDEF